MVAPGGKADLEVDSWAYCVCQVCRKKLYKLESLKPKALLRNQMPANPFDPDSDNAATMN